MTLVAAMRRSAGYSTGESLANQRMDIHRIDMTIRKRNTAATGLWMLKNPASMMDDSSV